MTSKAREVDLVLSVNGERIVVKGKSVPAGRHPHPEQDVHDQAPRLWQPGKPELYPMTVSVDEDMSAAPSTGCASACASWRWRLAG